MSDKSTQFVKPASPYFDHIKFGTTDRGIGADKAQGNAGGEVRREKFARDPLAKPSSANDR
jgi:hypothetical protein